jgi:hypothetical protein
VSSNASDLLFLTHKGGLCVSAYHCLYFCIWSIQYEQKLYRQTFWNGCKYLNIWKNSLQYHQLYFPGWQLTDPLNSSIWRDDIYMYIHIADWNVYSRRPPRVKSKINLGGYGSITWSFVSHTYTIGQKEYENALVLALNPRNKTL